MAEKEKKVIKGITKSGFSFEIDEDTLNDAELLEELISLDKGDATKYPEVVKMILGEDQKKALYDHIRNEKGRVPLDKLSNEIIEIFQTSKSGKN